MNHAIDKFTAPTKKYHGYGGQGGGIAGHRKNGQLIYGNGCLKKGKGAHVHPDCFTCPLPDCKYVRKK